MWDLWWKKWHWDRFFPKYFGFPLSISFLRCSITRKNEKTLIISFTGLHNKPSRLWCVRSICCGALHKKKGTKCVFIICSETFSFRDTRYRIMLQSINWSDHGRQVVQRKQVQSTIDCEQMCAPPVVLWIQLIGRKHLGDRRLGYSPFSCDIAWISTRLSFHSCSYGILFACCTYGPWATWHL
jgi:hypothetical protein